MMRSAARITLTGMLLGLLLVPGAQAGEKAVDPEVLKYMKMLNSRRQNSVIYAIRMLSVMGERARPAVPELAKFVKSGGTYCRDTITALGQLGPVGNAAIPALVERLDDFTFRRPAIYALVKMSPESRKAGAPKIIAHYKTIDRKDRRWGSAFYRVSMLGPEVKEVLSLIITVTKSKKQDEARRGILALEGMRAAAVPTLLKLLDSPDYRKRNEAARTLAKIGPDARSALAAIRKRLLAQPAHHDTLVVALRKIAPNDKSLADVYEKVIVATGSSVAYQAAAKGLAACYLKEPKRKQLVRTATAMMHHRSSSKRIKGIYILGAVGEGDKKVVGILARSAVMEKEAWHRSGAAMNLGLYRPVCKEQLDGLVKVLKDKEAYVRVAAAESLAGLGKGAAPVLAQLKAALADKDPRVRVWAAGAMWRVTGKTSESLNVFKGAVKGRNVIEGQAILTFLSEMAPHDRDAMSFLLELMRHRNDSMRKLTVRVVGDLGAACAPAITALEKQVREGENWNRGSWGHALYALRAIKDAIAAKDKGKPAPKGVPPPDEDF
jgi:HEAT repeat protein